MCVQSAVTCLQIVLASHLLEHRSPRSSSGTKPKRICDKRPLRNFFWHPYWKILQSECMGTNRNLRRCESWEGEREQGKGDASLRFIGEGTANLISKSIEALKEKNKDEREHGRRLSAGAFRDPRARCLFQ